MPGIPLFSVLMMVARPEQAEAGHRSLPDMLVDSALLSPLFHHNSVQHPLKSEHQLQRPSVLPSLSSFIIIIIDPARLIIVVRPNRNWRKKIKNQGKYLV